MATVTIDFGGHSIGHLPQVVTLPANKPDAAELLRALLEALIAGSLAGTGPGEDRR